MPKSKAANYHDMLCPMMSFIHEGLTFGATHVFTRAELEAVTPEKILMHLLVLQTTHDKFA